MMDSSDQKAQESEILERVVRRRRTEKVIARTREPLFDAGRCDTAADAVVSAVIAMAGWAPFHYPRDIAGVPEPWRAHQLRQPDATRLADWLELPMHAGKGIGKIPGMLRACGCLVLVTWLPEAGEGASEKRLAVDREHLAAAAAMVQNLLLGLESRGLGSYWSSGGVLGEGDVAQSLGIGTEGRLLAAVFVDYGWWDGDTRVERVPGKLRDRRTDPQQWSRVISFEG